MKNKLCECGCNKEVKPGNRFLVGHSGGQPDLLHSTNNGSTTESLKVISEATVAILQDGKIMIQSELYGNIEKQEETTCSLMEVCNV